MPSVLKSHVIGALTNLAHNFEEELAASEDQETKDFLAVVLSNLGTFVCWLGTLKDPRENGTVLDTGDTEVVNPDTKSDNPETIPPVSETTGENQPA